jgi:RimJ/RimL family protein N-acetyltransferase
MMVSIRTSRLVMTEFQMSDAEDVFGCITPAITTFVYWDVPASFDAYKTRREQWLDAKPAGSYSFVVRRRDTEECLGITSLDDGHTATPELGIWLKESAHAKGYGTEAIKGVAEWASRTLGKEAFLYPVAIPNIPSRRIAEALGGEIVGTRSSPKYESVVYRIPWAP